ncbi:MFS transporter [Streptomyces cinnamoneus]|uniref:MFS transporter n=1 Tax=Streptomyces cinnamoneus TaxID=53446 RepID=UPI00341861FD
MSDDAGRDRTQSLAVNRLPGVLIRERARPERIRAHPSSWRLAVATVCSGAFMGQLDASIVAQIHPSLRAAFGASLDAVTWVSLAYLLTVVALLLPAGRLSDACGRKLLYLYGFVLFTAASAGCALAQTLGVLIGLRVVQGAGAALLQANSIALVAASAPPGRLRPALSIQAAAQALGLALGPLAGGALVTVLDWRWIFLLNVPTGLVTLIAGHYLLPRTRHRHRTSGFDGLGPALLATVTTGTLLALSCLSRATVSLWWAALLLAVAAVAAAGFAVRQRRVPCPLIGPELLRPRPVRYGLAGTLGGYLILFGPLVLVPLVLTAHGCSALEAGLILSGLPAGFVLAAATTEKTLPRAWSERARCTCGAVMATAALAALCALPLTPAVLPPPLVLLGFGLGVFVPANNAIVMGAIPPHSSGTGGGLVNMARGTGTALGVAVVTQTLQMPGTGTWPHPPHRAVLVLLAVASIMVVTTRAARTRHSPG